MHGVSRAGWIVSAAFFALLLSSIVHVDYVGAVPELALLAILVGAAVRPALGVTAVGLLIPIAWYLASQQWNPSVSWAEAIACAVLTGLSIDAARGPADRRVPRAVAVPLWLFATLVATSIVASLGVMAVRLGPAFTDALVTHVTRQHFIDLRGFPALHAGVLLLEGLLLCALLARMPPADAALRRAATAATAGAAIAAVLNVLRLVGAASRSDTFWASLAALSLRLRWNVHYADVNAAGSYFALTMLAGMGAAAAGSRRWRLIWSGGAALSAVALWLTGSRVAELAAILALAGAMLGWRTVTGRMRLLPAAIISAVAVVLLVVIAVALPHRGNQQSSVLAADVRLGLAQTSLSMLAGYPVFGIGLGEFYQRSGEFSSPALIEKFPVAVHENAHNNFLQIAAELGIPGGVLFLWLVMGGLEVIGRHAWRRRDPSVLLLFAGLAAFALTCLGGHPLLIPEPAYVFWMLLGAGVGTAAPIHQSGTRRPWILPVCCLAIALALPWRVQATLRDADLEHVGIGVSPVWQVSPDGVRYREAQGRATLFVPAASAFKFRVNVRGETSTRLELTLDGRVADVVSLGPQRWTDVILPARTVRPDARYRPLELRLIENEHAAIWITKVEPLVAR